MRSLTLLVVTAAVASAQGNAPATVACRGQRIDSITVDASAPTVAGLRRVPVIGDIVRNTHVVTRENVVRGFVLMKVGEPCSEIHRAESERILIAQPFIADASIDVFSNARGGVNVVVHTVDEASLIVSGSAAGGPPQLTGLKIGSSNLDGLGVHASFAWRYEPFFDDRVAIRIADYQFDGRPYILDLASTREPLGRDDHAGMTLPFRTDLQRYAWRTLIGESRSHAQFEQCDTGQLILGYQRQYAEIGGIGRLGPPGKLTLFGLSFTNERAWPDTQPERLLENGFRNDTAALFAGRFMENRAARVNALLGLRGLKFRRVRGFDALRGAQDIPIGLQLGTLVGRGVRAFGANSNDVFVASDIYLGFGSSRHTTRIQAQGEGRKVLGDKDWQGLVGSGRASRYSKVSTTRTRIYSIEWSGTSRVTIPHALSLGSPDGGLRGFKDSKAIGGRRGIARVEENFYLGSPKSFGDLGLAWFAEAGQLWKGDLPYGETTQVRGSGGIAILLAAPMRSTRMWRLEFAAPINPETGARKWEIRLTHSDHTTFFWREPGDIEAARAKAVPASVYSWP